jgi:hypothetical protein
MCSLVKICDRLHQAIVAWPYKVDNTVTIQVLLFARTVAIISTTHFSTHSQAYLGTTRCFADLRAPLVNLTIASPKFMMALPASGFTHSHSPSRSGCLDWICKPLQDRSELSRNNFNRHKNKSCCLR